MRAGSKPNKTSGGMPNEVDFALDMLKVLPHSIQASVGPNWCRAWCTLLAEGLSTSTNDLMLKHGASIPGDWTVLGVLDSLPRVSPENAPAPDFTDMEEIGVKLMDTFVLSTRNMLGRPAGAYGLTPLLIFREIGRRG
jgi:hypothetical protein